MHEREHLHDAPQARDVRGANEHQELLAAREEDRKARQAGVDIELVDAALVQPHELVAVAAELSWSGMTYAQERRGIL